MDVAYDQGEGLSLEHGKVLHDAQVHKIEPESQNAELRAVHEALEAERSRFRDLYDGTPVGILTLGEDDVILEANMGAASVLGFPREELIGLRFTALIQAEDQDGFRHQESAGGHEGRISCELRTTRQDGSFRWIRLQRGPVTGFGPGTAGGHYILSDITDEKYRESVQGLTTLLLTRIDLARDFHECLLGMTYSLQDWSGCEAVGIRFKDAEDYPFFETRGFAVEHIQAENLLCARGPGGELLRDRKGNAVLECLCGDILRGRFDPSLPYFTGHGSFWTNSGSSLAAHGGQAARALLSRGRCVAEGYESIALIPLRMDGEALGLLQFNDHRPGRFSPAFINLVERLADTLALALSRRRAIDSLRESELKYRLLFEQMQEGITLHEAICDADGRMVDARYIDVNPACERLTGHRPQDLIGKTVLEAVPGTDPRRIEEFGQVVETGVPLSFEYYAESVGRQLFVHTFRPGEGQFANIFQDITDLKKVEGELREKKILLENIIDSSVDLIFVKDHRLRTIMCNKACAAMLGKEPAELIGKTDIENGWDPRLVQGDPGSGIPGYEYFDNLALAGQTVHVESDRVSLADGARVFDSIKIPLRDGRGRVFAMVGISRDITERVEARSLQARHERELESLATELRDLNHHLLAAREEERKSIAAEIHDDLGQRLTAMGLGLHYIAGRLEDGHEGLRAELEALIERNRESLLCLQGLASSLRPRLLDDLGLEAALAWLLANLGKTGVPELSLACDLAGVEPDPQTGTATFRIVQEALTNVIRHAEAAHARISVKSRDRRLFVRIQDDGVGIDPEDRDDPRSFGVLGMRERVMKLGGSFSLVGEAGKGTVLSVERPLEAQEDVDA